MILSISPEGESEIRQSLAELVGKDKPTEDETRSMTDLDAEYRVNETRYRAALVSEEITRKTLKQSGPAIEAAIRRDMQSAIRVKLDEAAFLGTGASGQPLGVIQGASTYGITETALNAAATWSSFRSAVTRFMMASAAGSPSAVKLLIRPEVYDDLDWAFVDAGSGLSLADVTGADLTRRALALVARTLALRGECVMLITDQDIIPASDWVLPTRNGAPTAYRLSLPEVGCGTTQTALAVVFLHFRIEPHRVCRRLICLSYAAMSFLSRAA